MSVGSCGNKCGGDDSLLLASPSGDMLLGSIFSGGPYLAWGLKHIADIRKLLEDAQAVGTAAGIQAKGEALKAVIDDGVAVLIDYPGLPKNLMHAGVAHNPVGSAQVQIAAQVDAYRAALTELDKAMALPGGIGLITWLITNGPAIYSLLQTIVGVIQQISGMLGSFSADPDQPPSGPVLPPVNP